MLLHVACVEAPAQLRRLEERSQAGSNMQPQQGTPSGQVLAASLNLSCIELCPVCQVLLPLSGAHSLMRVGVGNLSALSVTIPNRPADKIVDHHAHVEELRMAITRKQ